MKRPRFISKQNRLKQFRQPYILEIEKYLIRPRKAVKKTLFQALPLTGIWGLLFSVLAALEFDFVEFLLTVQGFVFHFCLLTILVPGLWIKWIYQSIVYLRVKKRLNIWDLDSKEILLR